MKNLFLGFTALLTFYFFAISPMKAQDLSTGLISVWDLDETSGTTAYDNQNTNNGTIDGATINQAGKVGNCYQFNAVNNDKVIVFDDNSLSFLNNNDSLTFSVWVKLDNGASGYSYILSKKNEYDFFLWGNEIHLRIYNSGTSTYVSRKSNGIVPRDGVTWANIITTYDGSGSFSGVKHYLDGTEIETYNLQGSTISGMANTSNDLIIGRHETNGSTFQGYLDQISVWDRTLTADEISELYNSGNGLSYEQWSGIENDSTGIAGAVDTTAIGGKCMVFYTNTLQVSGNEVSMSWPETFPSDNYFLYLRAWTDDSIDGKVVEVHNGIFDLNKTTTGFSLNVKNPNGYVTYYAADTTDCETNFWIAANGHLTPIDSTHEVRIGSTVDYGNYNLQVDGNSFYNGTLTSEYTMTASNFILSSDARLKSDINPINKKVSSVNLRQFKFKKDPTQRLRYGVIAQELEKVAPEMVYEGEDGYKKVAYTDFLITRLAELEAKIFDLEYIIKELQDEK